MFVKFSEILIHGQKLLKLLARYFKLDFNPLIHVCTSFMFAQLGFYRPLFPFSRLDFLFVFSVKLTSRC